MDTDTAAAELAGHIKDYVARNLTNGMELNDAVTAAVIQWREDSDRMTYRLLPRLPAIVHEATPALYAHHRGQ